MISLLKYILFALALTCAFEIVPLLFVRGNKKKWIASSLLCNVITNPIINIIFMLVALAIENENVTFGILILLEVLVVAFEAFLYHNITDESIKKCIKISFVCNLFSFVLGLLLFNLVEYAINPTGPNDVLDISSLNGCFHFIVNLY